MLKKDKLSILLISINLFAIYIKINYNKIMKKFIITFFSILLIGLTSIGGGLLLSACDNSSYSENGGGILIIQKMKTMRI